jgi:hypothetical protein
METRLDLNPNGPLVTRLLGEPLIQAIASALEAITPQDAINWFASFGYSLFNSL